MNKAHFPGLTATGFGDPDGALFIWNQRGIGWRFVHYDKAQDECALVGKTYRTKPEILHNLPAYAVTWGFRIPAISTTPTEVK